MSARLDGLTPGQTRTPWEPPSVTPLAGPRSQPASRATDSPGRALHRVQGVSYPRSGHHLLVELLKAYFHTTECQGVPYTSRPLDGYAKIGAFSYCEFYHCCQRIPCAQGATFGKQHDFDFSLENRIGQRYLIQYRHPVPTILSDFERTDDRRFAWPEFAVWQANEWNRWMSKWVLNNHNPKALFVFYDDLVQNTPHVVSKVLRHFGHEPIAEVLPPRQHFLRRRLDTHDVSNIIRITRPIRAALNMPELPGMHPRCCDQGRA